LFLNLPCLSLEDSEDCASAERPFLDNHNKREWENLSHLPLESSSGEVSTRFSIYETRTTVVISGCSNSDWFGYALGNIGPVDTSPKDEDENEDNGSAGEDYEDTEPQPEEDFFATGGCEPVLNPNKILWDPRIYFLRATQIRLSIATQASEYLDWVSGL
jgi:hypothetical protein